LRETLTAAASGTCSIFANIAQDGNYTAATSTGAPFTFSKASQSAITITSTSAVYGTNLSLTISGGSTGGTAVFYKASGNCTISGTTLTPTGTGTCSITATLETNANYLAETSTVTTINISSGSASASLTLAPGNLIYRQAKVITAIATVAGKITFKAGTKVIAGCKNKVVSAGNSYTATCSYKPSNHSYVVITAQLSPADLAYIGTVTQSAQYLVTRRTGAR
jgi:hypothetical protein